MIYRTLQVPASGAVQPMPPNPQGPSFSDRQKRKQKIVQGEDPLKIPRGSALAASPLHPHGRDPLW